jgi:hypothetical protein
MCILELPMFVTTKTLSQCKCKICVAQLPDAWFTMRHIFFNLRCSCSVMGAYKPEDIVLLFQSQLDNLTGNGVNPGIHGF